MTSCNQCTKEYSYKGTLCNTCRSRKSRGVAEGVASTRTCEGVHELDKCLSKEDWKEIKSEILRSPGQMFKICSTNYASINSSR